MRNAKSGTSSMEHTNGDIAAFGKSQFEALVQAQSKLLGQVEDLNRAWLSSMRAATDSSIDIVGRLARCTDPAEAARIYNEWLVGRASALVSDGQKLTEMWVGVCGAAIEPARSAAETAVETTRAHAKTAGAA